MAGARHSTLWVSLLLFGSGMTALVYQTTWLRELRLVFGASTASSAAVLAIFMGGLGLGGLIIGRRVDRSDNPLRVYANLELIIALLVATTPFLIQLGRWVYFQTGGTFALGHGQGTAIKLLLSTAILGVPAFLMGGTLPAAAKAIETTEDVNRRLMAFVYGTNTLGAVTGALITTFLLLEIFGNRTTLWIACLINLLVAIAARRMSEAGTEKVVDDAETIVFTSDEPDRAAPVWFVLVASGVSGFVFFLLEIVWYRMLGPILGGSVFSFGLILAVALLGIGLGSFLYSLTLSGKRVTAFHFGVTAGLEALFIILPFAIGDSIALATLLSGDVKVLGFSGSVTLWTLATAAVVLPAATVAGFQFPLLVALLGKGGEKIGSDIGRAYLANTIGAIAGSLAGGFGLLPLLGATGLWRLSAVLILAIGVVAFLLPPVRLGRGRSIAGAGVAVVVVILLFAEGPTAIWRHTGIGAGRARDTFENSNELTNWEMYQRRGIVIEREGVESAMAVSGSSGYALLINGKSDGNSIGDAGTQIMGGLLGPLLHPSPGRVMIVGLGTGSSAGWAADAFDVVEVDVVELEPAVIEMAHLSSTVNQDVVTNPDVNILLGDAREYILTTDRYYDVIFSEPSNPYRAGVASLFTREFYQAAASRLSTDGIFVQWLQSYEISPESVASVYATMTTTFPHVQTWMSQSGDMLLVATREPLKIDTRMIAGKLTQPGYREGVRYGWGAHDPEGVLARLITTQPLHRLLGREDAAINRDDHNSIEFAFARTVGSSVRVRPRDLYSMRQSPIDQNLIRGPIDEALTERRLLSAFSYHGSEAPLPQFQDNLEMYEIVNSYAGGALASIPIPTRSTDHLDFVEKTAIATGLAERGDPLALSLIEDLALTRPIEAEMLRARYLARTEEPNRAVESLVNAFVGMRSYPWTPSSEVSRAMELSRELSGEFRDPDVTGALLDSISERFAASSSDQARLLLQARLSMEPWMAPCNPAFMRVVDELGRFPIWGREFLSRRAGCLEKAGHPLADLAFQQLKRHEEQTPPRPSVSIDPEPEELPPDTESDTLL